MKAETKLKLNLRPMKDGKVDTQHVHRFSAEEFRQEVVSSQIEGFSEAVQVYKSKVSSLETSDSKHPEIIFLGTASSCPGKDRNVSAIWVNITDDVAILLDCGEGTYGQLVRLFGPDKVGSNLAKLKGIFISHLHADHQLGLIKVLIERSKFEKSPVHIILPSSVVTWLKDYDQIYEKVKDTFIPYLSETVVANAPKTVLDDLRLIRLQTARVKHCRDSFGISITTADNDYFKISYSGDSAQPSPHFDSIAKSSNVLIHEATMEDELEEEAKIKNHSTTSQAIEVADRVNAEYLILTHFSQRYAKLPIISETMKKKKKIGIAFDNMRITRSNLRRLPLLFEPLEKLFVEYIEENLQRQQRKQIKQDQLAKLKLM
ncbi:Ribonuclease Z, mitochondrial [Halotydeus destructor]|nr:Ribonuclease Z, mitochondrial [Halotydeus destructor]